MEKTKQSLFALISLLICSAALSPLSAQAQNNNVMLPSGTYDPYANLRGWSIGAGLEYKQFSNNGTTFAESSNHKIYNINPSYHVGYDFHLGYSIPGTNTDFNLDYTRIHTSDTRDVWAINLNLFPGALDLGPVTWARAKLTFDYDSVDLTAGQWIGITSQLNLNLYGGLNYTRFKKRMETSASGFGNTFFIQGGTTYNGIGPTFGIDAYVSPFPGAPTFSVYGGMESTFLYGRMSGFVDLDLNGLAVSDDIPDEKIVVPAFGGKLGLNWRIPYNGMMWDIKAQYDVKQYFGITKDSNYNSPINASFQGPSVRVILHF